MEVAGWGQLTADHAIGKVFNQAQLALSDEQYCNDYYNGQYNPELMICAHDQDGNNSAESVCRGDSGGPLISRNGNESTLVGVVNWVPNCGVQDMPNVFARVANFTDWIDQASSALLSGIDADLQQTAIAELNGTTEFVIKVKNSSNAVANIGAVTVENNRAAISANSCTSLAVNASCEIKLSASQLFEHPYQVMMADVSINGLKHPVYLKYEKQSLIQSSQANDGVVLSSNGTEIWFDDSQGTTDFLRSGDFGDGGYSELAFDLTGPGRLSFKLAVSSEWDFDLASLFVNNPWPANIVRSGGCEWSDVEVRLPHGQHHVWWDFRSDGVLPMGQDMVALQDITWQSDQSIGRVDVISEENCVPDANINFEQTGVTVTPSVIISPTATMTTTVTPTIGDLTPTVTATITPTQVTGIEPFVAGQTNPVNGKMYQYQGLCWTAQHNPGTWETPKAGWFWSETSCGVISTATLTPTISATLTATPSAIINTDFDCNTKC